MANGINMEGLAELARQTATETADLIEAIARSMAEADGVLPDQSLSDMIRYRAEAKRWLYAQRALYQFQMANGMKRY